MANLNVAKNGVIIAGVGVPNGTPAPKPGGGNAPKLVQISGFTAAGNGRNFHITNPTFQNGVVPHPGLGPSQPGVVHTPSGINRPTIIGQGGHLLPVGGSNGYGGISTALKTGLPGH